MATYKELIPLAKKAGIKYFTKNQETGRVKYMARVKKINAILTRRAIEDRLSDQFNAEGHP